MSPSLSFGGRLIPARAGKTDLGGLSHYWHPAHPRAGGENEALAASDATDKGSSPRGRGKPCRRRVSRPVGGLIPARAGKTSTWGEFDKAYGAHPRAGGENLTQP